MAQHADVIGYLAARQLATLTRLGALCHLDLDLVGRDQVLGRHTEAAGGHLLDPAAQRVVHLQGIVGHDRRAHHAAEPGTLLHRDAFELITIPGRIFASLAGVTLAADAAHRHRKRCMRLGGN